MMRIEVAESADALSRAVADLFVRVTTDAVRARSRCAVALSGGSTPKSIYRLLASEPFRARVQWEQIEFFWGDERHVPLDHADSNYRMAAETLLSKVPVRPRRIHHVRAGIPDAALAAQEYEDDIRSTLGADAMPRFDLILLGLGADGHTASLFPGTAAVTERQRLCVANWVPRFNAHRITMTFPLINAARLVAFIVSGADKAAIVQDVLHRRGEARRAPADLTLPPACLVEPVDGDLWWMLDRDAAGKHES
jgi:6-phosphogluconolactonase